MEFLHNLFVFVLLFACANGLSVTAEASKTELGGTATIRCILVINATDTAVSLIIRRETVQYVVFYNANGMLKWPNETNSRYLYDLETHTMSIQDVRCGAIDEAPTTCTLTGFDGARDGNRVIQTAPVAVYVEVRPQTPNAIVTDPADVTSGINEGSRLSATCSANVGREGKGRIHWRIYRGNKVEEVPLGNPKRQERAATDEENCTKRHGSILTLNALGVEDQDLVLTCFVENDDFQPDIPSACNGPDDLCSQTEKIKVLYSVRNINVNGNRIVAEGDAVDLTCTASGYPEPTYAWYKVVEGNSTLMSSTGTYRIDQAEIGVDDGNYFCVASNLFNGENVNITRNVTLVVDVRPTTPEPTDPPSTSDAPTDGTPAAKTSDDDDDNDTVIIVVVVVVVVLAIVVAAVAFYCWKSRRNKEIIEEPSEKPYYNNRQNLAYVNSQPDLVTTDSKKPNAPSLNNSFDMNTEDALRYADLTYDNRPRSRKPMAIGDTSSEYSDIQMPQV